jgi:hypothetical protein
MPPPGGLRMPALSDDPQAPDPNQIRAALLRVCTSRPFDTSPKLTSFLRFVVEAALSGRAERLKGYTIGVEALGRPENFDPQADPIVRVEAVRLRRALAAYYAGAGARDPMVIEVPRGRYVPCFRWAKRSAPRTIWLRARGVLQRLLAA